MSAFCDGPTYAAISDDTGALADTGVGCFAVDNLDGSAVVDSLVIATDEAPSVESLEALLGAAASQGFRHAVMLSRIGASKGGFGLGKWNEAEAAVKAISGTPNPIPSPNPNPTPKPTTYP